MSRAKRTKAKKPESDKDRFVININKTDMGEEVRIMSTVTKAETELALEARRSTADVGLPFDDPICSRVCSLFCSPSFLSACRFRHPDAKGRHRGGP